MVEMCSCRWHILRINTSVHFPTINRQFQEKNMGFILLPLVHVAARHLTPETQQIARMTKPFVVGARANHRNER